MSFMVSPYRVGTYVAPTTNVVFATQDFASGSATGNLDVTSSTITGVTPKAVITVGSNYDTASGSTETDHAVMSLGWGTDAEGPAYIASRSRDAQATTSDATISATITQLYGILSPSAASNVESANSSMISGGHRLNFSSNDATDRRGMSIMVAGTDVTVDKLHSALATGGTTLNHGFQPDVVLCMNNGDDGSGTLTAFWFSFGICVRNDNVTSGIKQHALLVGENNGQADGKPFMTIDTDCSGGQMGLGGTADYTFALSAFTGTGETGTASVSMGTDVAFLLALKLNSRKVCLKTFQTPTSTGNWTISGVGFLPQSAIAVLTNLEALDDYPGATSAQQSGFSISFIGDEQWSTAVRIEASAATTNTASLCQNLALLGPSATACDAHKSTLVGWNTDGVTFNASATQGTAKYGFILFIE
jgi:hypothetical protein